MGVINDDLVDQDSDVRVDTSLVRGYLVTAQTNRKWHAVLEFRKEEIPLLCGPILVAEDDLLVFDIEEEEIYSGDYDWINTPHSICHECMPKFKEIVQWETKR